MRHKYFSLLQHVSHSVPSAQQSPSRHPPPRPPSLSTSVDSGAYAPLTMSTMEQPSLYQAVATSATPGRQSPASRQTPTAHNGSAGVYQPLGRKDEPSTYAVSLPSTAQN